MQNSYSFITETIASFLLFAAEAAAAEKGGGGTSDSFFFIPFVLIAILFYFMMIRPERAKRQELDDLVANLKKNDKVITIGGIIGTVVTTSKDSDELTIRIDENNNTKMKIQRTSVKTVVTDKDATSSE